MNGDCTRCEVHFREFADVRIRTLDRAACPYCGSTLKQTAYMGGVTGITTHDVTTGVTTTQRRPLPKETLYRRARAVPLPADSFLIAKLRDERGTK